MHYQLFWRLLLKDKTVTPVESDNYFRQAISLVPRAQNLSASDTELYYKYQSMATDVIRDKHNKN